jgi:hypothetical protein
MIAFLARCSTNHRSSIEQIRAMHRTAVAYARGIRRTHDTTSPSNTRLDQKMSTDEDDWSMPIQEQFARLEQQTSTDETMPNDIDHDETRTESRPSIDPRTTSVLLFPGQGTQFVGMGSVRNENHAR